jgi:hypothetical protein
MSELSELDISENLLLVLPPWLGQMRSLSVLNVDENPIIAPDRSVIGRGFLHLQQLLRKRASEEYCAMMGSEQMLALCRNEAKHWCDVALHADDGVVMAHQVVLTIKSPELAAAVRSASSLDRKLDGESVLQMSLPMHGFKRNVVDMFVSSLYSNTAVTLGFAPSANRALQDLALRFKHAQLFEACRSAAKAANSAFLQYVERSYQPDAVTADASGVQHSAASPPVRDCWPTASEVLSNAAGSADIFLRIGSRSERAESPAIGAHCVLLHAMSVVGRLLLADPAGDAANSKRCIQQVWISEECMTPEGLRIVVEYIYRNTDPAQRWLNAHGMHLGIDQVIALVPLTVIWELPGLVKECEEVLLDAVTAARVCRLLEIAVEFGLQRLQAKCLSAFFEVSLPPHQLKALPLDLRDLVERYGRKYGRPSLFKVVAEEAPAHGSKVRRQHSAVVRV